MSKNKNSFISNSFKNLFKSKATLLKVCLLSLLFIGVLTYVIITSFFSLSNDITKDTKFYLNTSCTIEIHEMKSEKAQKIISDAFSLCDTYEKQFSRTVENSDIWKINHAEQGKKTSVDKETVHVIKSALKVASETKGIFDVSVGQLSELWDFTSLSPSVPKQADIQTALATVDYKNISILNDHLVSIKKLGTHIDLGAVAKGYIADKLVEFLEKEGVKSGIVNLGGNIVAIGSKGDRSWNIGIELPYSHQTDIIGSVSVENKTIVTSGVFERFFEENGVKYHHIVDPNTGYPKNTDVVLVSIMADKGKSMYCDLYSTTCLLLGKEEAIKFMKNKKGFEYCIVDTDNNITKSLGFNLVPK